MCATPLGKICVSDHAMNATEEMSAMNRDIQRFFDENGAEYPTWKELEKEAGEYLKDKNRFERQNKRGQSVRTAPLIFGSDTSGRPKLCFSQEFFRPQRSSQPATE